MIPAAAKCEAAVRLMIVFDTYGNVARRPIDEETSAIYNLAQELAGKHAAEVASATPIERKR